MVWACPAVSPPSMFGYWFRLRWAGDSRLRIAGNLPSSTPIPSDDADPRQALQSEVVAYYRAAAAHCRRNRAWKSVPCCQIERLRQRRKTLSNAQFDAVADIRGGGPRARAEHRPSAFCGFGVAIVNGRLQETANVADPGMADTVPVSDGQTRLTEQWVPDNRRQRACAYCGREHRCSAALDHHRCATQSRKCGDGVIDMPWLSCLLPWRLNRSVCAAATTLPIASITDAAIASFTLSISTHGALILRRMPSAIFRLSRRIPVYSESKIRYQTRTLAGTTSRRTRRCAWCSVICARQSRRAHAGAPARIRRRSIRELRDAARSRHYRLAAIRCR